MYPNIQCLLQLNFICVCLHRFNSAKKDNDFVYHDKIPAFDTLPEIKGLLLFMCMHVRVYLCMMLDNIIYYAI